MEARPKTAFGLKPIHFFREMKMDADGKIFDRLEEEEGQNGDKNHYRPHVDASNYTTFSFHESFDRSMKPVFTGLCRSCHGNYSE